MALKSPPKQLPLIKCDSGGSSGGNVSKIKYYEIGVSGYPH